MKSNLIVMGVCGTGKSTLGIALAEALGMHFIDGDDLHPSNNIDKMRQGQPLDDDDRWPWFDKIVQHLEADFPCIIACSALKFSYRERLRQSHQPLTFIFLDGLSELIEQRLHLRGGHFMQANMLSSQLNTLEKPIDEDDVLTLSISLPIDQQIKQVRALLINQA
jgi:gluconokinase